MSALIGLQCHLCKAVFPAEATYVCEKCLGPLEPLYDYAAIRLTHDEIAKRLKMSPQRLQTILHKLEGQRWLTVKNDFVYPTVAALRWQNPDLSENAAGKIIRSLK